MLSLAVGPFGFDQSAGTLRVPHCTVASSGQVVQLIWNEGAFVSAGTGLVPMMAVSTAADTRRVMARTALSLRPARLGDTARGRSSADRGRRVSRMGESSPGHD